MTYHPLTTHQGVDSLQIPVIDVDQFRTEGHLRELDVACTQWGCFQIVNHGIPDVVIASLHTQMEMFFDLPLDKKKAIERTKSNPWGFFDQELTKNIQDLKEIFDVGPKADSGPLAGSSPQWPESMPAFKSAIRGFYDASQAIAEKILAGISQNLGMPGDYLTTDFGERQTSFLRLNYYPVWDQARENLGISHHTDAGAVTVMAQDMNPGLQICRDDEWHTVVPRSDALVINIGDIVQVWSNDRYTAPLHRVLASVATKRYSAPFFFNPDYDLDYAPVAGVVGEDSPALYRSINWGEFRAGRAAGDYADYGEEIQISHYRLD